MNREIEAALNFLRKARRGGHPALRRMIRRVLLSSARRGYVVTRGTMEPYEKLTSEVLVDADSYAGLWDYVRRATVELLSREPAERGIAGAVAEVGVGWGDFAIVMNTFFPERTFYLFDTFSGFNKHDQNADTSLGLPHKPYETLPAGHPPELVTGRLPNPERTVIHVGWFPESAVGLEGETFVFAHIDVGLFSPTYAAMVLRASCAVGTHLRLRLQHGPRPPALKRAVNH